MHPGAPEFMKTTPARSKLRPVWVGFLCLTVLLMTGCSSFMHGYTQRKANHRYLLVDEENDSFGYQRMTYNLGYNRSLKPFVKEHGMPDFIFEYPVKGAKSGICMYYLEEDKVYIYESSSMWVADSLFLKEVRNLTEEEKERYRFLLRQKEEQADGGGSVD